MCLFPVRYREELKMFSHLINWKAIANFVVGVLNFFDDSLIHSSSKKQLLPLCIPIRWWRCILHLPLSNLLWQWTFWEVLGATFDPSLENSWNLVGILRHSRHMNTECWEDRDTSIENSFSPFITLFPSCYMKHCQRHYGPRHWLL